MLPGGFAARPGDSSLPSPLCVGGFDSPWAGEFSGQVHLASQLLSRGPEAVGLDDLTLYVIGLVSLTAAGKPLAGRPWIRYLGGLEEY